MVGNLLNIKKIISMMPSVTYVLLLPLTQWDLTKSFSSFCSQNDDDVIEQSNSGEPTISKSTTNEGDLMKITLGICNKSAEVLCFN